MRTCGSTPTGSSSAAAGTTAAFFTRTDRNRPEMDAAMGNFSRARKNLPRDSLTGRGWGWLAFYPPQGAFLQQRSSNYWCTYPSPGSSFLAREKAFLRAFFCQSGTVRIPCLRSLCTYNFLKSVHFEPRLAVYHPLFDCLDHMFTVYLPFSCMFAALDRGDCPRPPRSGEKNGGHTGA